MPLDRRVMGLFAVLSLAAACPAQAQNYPTRPVSIIVGIGAGGGPDVMLRIVGERLGQLWGQQAIVLNRPGGGGLIAVQAAVAAPPDGYTLFLGLGSNFYVLPETHPNLPFDMKRALAPIGLVGEQPMVIAVHPQTGVNTLAELLERARKEPATLLYGAGLGSLPHLTMERLASQAGVQFRLVPYPSTARAVQDTVAGTVSIVVEGIPALAGPIQSGSLKALAVVASQRLSEFPDLPTVGEAVSALKGFELKGWYALMAPAGTPEAIVAKVSHDLTAVLSEDALKQKLLTLGTNVRPLSPAQVGELIRSEQEVWKPIVQKAVVGAQ